MSKIATFYDHVRDAARQEGVSFTEALQEVKKLGVELLEVSQNNILGREDEAGRELAYAGLGISSVPAYFNFGRDLDVDKQSEPTLEAAEFLGAHKMLVIPGFFAPEDGPEERERQVENIVSCINRLAVKAAGYGISLVMEDFDNLLSPISTTAGIQRVLDGCPDLSFCFDTGNFRFMAEDALEAYREFRGRIGHVHLKDRAYTGKAGEQGLTALDGQDLYPSPVGSGEIPIGQIVAALCGDGYDGAYTIEHYGAVHMLDYLKESCAWLKNQLA